MGLHNIEQQLEQCLQMSDSWALITLLLDDLAAVSLAHWQMLARKKREIYFANGYISYSPKVFVPLTQLCRDICAYCTFAKSPKDLKDIYLTEQQVNDLVDRAQQQACREVLITLGEKPELRYAQAKEWLRQHACDSTLDYVAKISAMLSKRKDILVHVNAGCMSLHEYQQLKPYVASMGLMLEIASDRLMQKSQVHYACPDKEPQRRLQSLADAGRAGIAMTTGILIGIGETRAERITSLWHIAQLHTTYGHIQECIVQNFTPKDDIRWPHSKAVALDDLLWTIAIARLILPADIALQVPPNLNRHALAQLIDSGINDFGGISPITIDHVNPESAWPSLTVLRTAAQQQGFSLAPRLCVYPAYILDEKKRAQFIHEQQYLTIMRLTDGAALAREDMWLTGCSEELPADIEDMFKVPASAPDILLPRITQDIDQILGQLEKNNVLSCDQLVRLFNARDADFVAVCRLANDVCHAKHADTVSFVRNCNINYTNICHHHCSFCAFSKGTKHYAGKEAAYLMSMDQILQKAEYALEQGATELCLQGGIHPQFNGDTYLEICSRIHQCFPELHIHAFSPLEISHGANSLQLSLIDYLRQLQDKGLRSLPGTAAEILVDDIRHIICPDKIDTRQWLAVMESAHQIGLRSTATIMFGHVDNYRHWAEHLMHIRQLQEKTGGFTEFVPLPFVAQQAPVYLRGQARRGPTLRESVLMHAIARLYLHNIIDNIQVSWVKMGLAGAELCLQAGANDLGGLLLSESITRAAGARHGQLQSAAKLHAICARQNKVLRQRNTLYELLDIETVLRQELTLSC